MARNSVKNARSKTARAYITTSAEDCLKQQDLSKVSSGPKKSKVKSLEVLYKKFHANRDRLFCIGTSLEPLQSQKFSPHFFLTSVRSMLKIFLKQDFSTSQTQQVLDEITNYLEYPSAQTGFDPDGLVLKSIVVLILEIHNCITKLIHTQQHENSKKDIAFFLSFNDDQENFMDSESQKFMKVINKNFLILEETFMLVNTMNPKDYLPLTDLLHLVHKIIEQCHTGTNQLCIPHFPTKSHKKNKNVWKTIEPPIEKRPVQFIYSQNIIKNFRLLYSLLKRFKEELKKHTDLCQLNK